jgi:hypothetical protein
MRYWSGPGFGRMSGGLAHSTSVFLYTNPSSSSSCIFPRMNFSCGGAYLRADIRTGSAPSRSLMTMGFTFAGGFAPSLSLKTSLHSVTNCRRLCTPSRDMSAFSALLIILSIASTSSSGLPCLPLHHENLLGQHQECRHRKEDASRGLQTLRWAVARHVPRHHLLSAVLRTGLHQARLASFAPDASCFLCQW